MGRTPADGQHLQHLPVGRRLPPRLLRQYNGTYNFANVKAKHHANLAFVLEDLGGWEDAMTAELSAPKFRGGVRIHDFFSDDYTLTWLRIARAHPEVMFYCYTKEVRRFRNLVEPNAPANFLWVYSLGGTQDAELDLTDLLAVLGPRLVGVPANRIPHFLKLLGGRRFSQWQAEADGERGQRRARRLSERRQIRYPVTGSGDGNDGDDVSVHIPSPRPPSEP